MELTQETINYRYYDDTQRMSVELDIEDTWLKIDSSISFLFDTGSTTVSILAQELELTKEQEDYIKCHCKIKEHEGIVANSTIDYYIYNVSELRLGEKIILRDFPIHISFDPRARYSLLGMSFLKLFGICIIPNEKIMVFSPLKVVEQIVTGKVTAQNIENTPIIQNWADDTIPENLHTEDTI